MKKLSSICIGGAILLCGCGGESSTAENGDTLVTGQFLDTAVAGLSYQTETQSGVTNLFGEYSYIEGESVTFSIGDLIFPAVTAAKEVTPVSMSSANEIDNVAINIAWLLQSLDVDADLANGIELAGGADVLAAPVDFNVTQAEFSSNSSIVNMVANSGSANTSLVSVEDATSHLTDTVVATSYERYDTVEEYVELYDIKQVFSTNSENYFYIRANGTFDGVWNELVYTGTWELDSQGYFCRTVEQGPDYLTGEFRFDCQLWRMQDINTIHATRQRGASSISWNMVLTN